jgi:hypothetical protein
MTEKRNLDREIIEGLKDLKSGGGKHVTQNQEDYLLAMSRLEEKNPHKNLLFNCYIFDTT